MINIKRKRIICRLFRIKSLSTNREAEPEAEA